MIDFYNIFCYSFVCMWEFILSGRKKKTTEKVPCRFFFPFLFAFSCKNWIFLLISNAKKKKKFSWNINQHKFSSHSIMFYYISFLCHWILESSGMWAIICHIYDQECMLVRVTRNYGFMPNSLINNFQNNPQHSRSSSKQNH